jgi:hypothetical protein
MHCRDRLTRFGRGSGLRRILDYHVTRHPTFAAADLYKLLHQACLGPAHLGRSADSLQWLLDEWERVTPAPGHIVEPIDPRGRIVRLNLRPLKDAGGSALAVWRILLACSRETSEGRARLQRLLQASAALAERGVIPLDGREVRQQAALAKESGYPPGRHSPGYLSAEEPAYRVLPVRLLDERWDDLFPSARPCVRPSLGGAIRA